MWNSAMVSRKVLLSAWTLAIFLTILSVALHVSFARHAGGLWRDEINSLHLSQDPSWSALKADMRFDTFPALFTYIVKGWSKLFGSTLPSLRAFGVLCSLFTGVLAWVIVWRLGRRPPLAALVTTGFWSAAYLGGATLRPHGLSVATALLLFWLVSEYLKQQRARFLMLASAAALFSVQLEYVNILAVGAAAGAAILVFLMGRQWRHVAWASIWLGLLPALSLLPWRWHLSVIASWWHLVADRSSQPSLAAQFSAAGIALLVILVGSVFIIWAFRSQLERFWVAAVFAYSVALAVFLAVTAGHLVPQYFLPVVVIGSVMLDVIVARQQSLFWLALLGAASLIVIGTNIRPMLDTARFPMSSMPIVAAAIAGESRPGDIVIVAPWYMGVGYSQYAPASVPWITLPKLADSWIHRFPTVAQEFANPAAIEATLNPALEALARGSTVWVVSTVSDPLAYKKINTLNILPGSFATPMSYQKAVTIVTFFNTLADRALKRAVVVFPSHLVPEPPEAVTLIKYSGLRSIHP